jgi:hypothetical protein
MPASATRAALFRHSTSLASLIMRSADTSGAAGTTSLRRRAASALQSRKSLCSCSTSLRRRGLVAVGGLSLLRVVAGALRALNRVAAAIDSRIRADTQKARLTRPAAAAD